MQDFRKLRVWQVAHELGIEVARAIPMRSSRRIPGLRGQAVRSATSIGWNIVEGCGKSSSQEFYRYLESSLCSLMEMKSQLESARDAQIVSEARYAFIDRRSSMLEKMLISLMRRVADDMTGGPDDDVV